MLFAPSSTSAPFAAAGAVLYFAPLAGRRLAFWGLWLCAAVGLPAALDVLRGTTHLNYVRYVLLAGPAVFALVPTALAAAAARWRRFGWAAHAVPAVAVVACVAALPDPYQVDRAAPAEVVAALVPPLSPADLLVFASTPREAQFAGGQYLLFDRYLDRVPCPVVFLTGPAPAPVLNVAAGRPAAVWLFAADDA